MSTRLWTFTVLAAVTLSAHAQLRLPGLSLQGLPAQLPLQSLAQAADSADLRTLERLSEVRRAAGARLIHSNRRLIEADPNGEPIVRGEILALSPSDEALAHARALGFTVNPQTTLAPSDLRLFILMVPSGVATQHALVDLRQSDPGGSYDFNHIYTHAHAGGATAPAAGNPATREAAAPGPAGPDSTDRPIVRVGLLDTGVDASHPAFRTSVLHTWGCGNKSIPNAHGTAVAALLLTRGRAAVYAADVYCDSPTGGAVDTLIAALVWLISEQVPVVNVSLVGPRNLMLERVIATLVERGYLIVAAVGNDGPTAPPLYPAAYPNVVGVTGVDAKRRVLLEALRGPQVMFAAPGADIKGADLHHSLTEVRGTSFAAPVVAGLLAELVTVPERVAAQRAIETLATRAVDLGTPGKDLTYGFGLVASAPR